MGLSTPVRGNLRWDVASLATASCAHGTLVHEALLYRDIDEYVEGTLRFLQRGLEAGEPMMVAVPGPHLDALRGALHGDAKRIRFVDMTALGRNPGRIIPALHDWIGTQGRRPVRFVGEPIWPGRRVSETVEATRHESLLNLAFAETEAAILCPYDAGGLHADVLADAERTHPVLVVDGEPRASRRYTDPSVIYAAADWELPAATGPVRTTRITRDLCAARRFLRASVDNEAAMDPERLNDLLLAVNEATTNAVVHGRGPCLLSVWQADGHLVCEITDGGRIGDPLVGRRRPASGSLGGRGLWMINQLCDLVELRPGPRGTTLRLHMSLA
jgi:anti-sigma regulatory factor (Ser/Thr protein kinase)